MLCILHIRCTHIPTHMHAHRTQTDTCRQTHTPQEIKTKQVLNYHPLSFFASVFPDICLNSWGRILARSWEWLLSLSGGWLTHVNLGSIPVIGHARRIWDKDYDQNIMELCSSLSGENNVEKNDDYGLGKANSAQFTPVSDSKTNSNLP